MSDPDHIFVYGTLRASSTHAMAKRLRSKARLVGVGQASGRLYDMGWYPAALFDEDEKSCVVGDVFALRSDARLLAELDAYEIGNPSYVRRSLRVRLFDGRYVLTWAYGFASPPNAPLIRGGDFIEHWRAKTRRPGGS